MAIKMNGTANTTNVLQGMCHALMQADTKRQTNGGEVIPVLNSPGKETGQPGQGNWTVHRQGNWTTEFTFTKASFIPPEIAHCKYSTLHISTKHFYIIHQLE